MATENTGIPFMITKKLEGDLKSYGVTQAEIDTMTPKQAWELLQEKSLKEQIDEPAKEQVYSLEEIDTELDILQGLWQEAFDRMYDTSDLEKAGEILEVTSFKEDAQGLEEYLKKEDRNLSPEEKYFIQMSINVKKFKKRAKVRGSEVKIFLMYAVGKTASDGRVRPSLAVCNITFFLLVSLYYSSLIHIFIL